MPTKFGIYLLHLSQTACLFCPFWILKKKVKTKVNGEKLFRLPVLCARCKTKFGRAVLSTFIHCTPLARVQITEIFRTHSTSTATDLILNEASFFSSPTSGVDLGMKFLVRKISGLVLCLSIFPDERTDITINILVSEFRPIGVKATKVGHEGRRSRHCPEDGGRHVPVGYSTVCQGMQNGLVFILVWGFSKQLNAPGSPIPQSNAALTVKKLYPTPQMRHAA